MTYCEKSIEILQRTRDGNDLAPIHLKLIELAINGNLSDQGEIAFEALHQSVLKGYKKPWHCGLEHVTKDLEGYIYWRDTRLEHFSHRRHDDEMKATQRLAAACRHLEAAGREISFSNYCNASKNL